MGSWLYPMKRFNEIIILGIVVPLSGLLLSCGQERADYSHRCSRMIAWEAYDEAIEDCTQEIVLNPKSAVAYNQRGFVYLRLGNYSAAIKDYTQANQLQPNSALIYNNRCFAYYRVGEYPKALADCDQALHLHPLFAGAYSNRGLIRFALGDKSGAKEDYQKAVKLFLEAGDQQSYQIIQERYKKLQKPQI